MRRNRKPNRGTTIVIVILASFTLFAFVALAIDVGYLVNSRSELQRCADATAMAALWEYGHELSQDYHQETPHAQAALAGSTEATQLGLSNSICNEHVLLPTTDITWGYINDFQDPSAELDTTADNSTFNAVKVRIRRADGVNGKIPLFFARVFGYESLESEAIATGGMVREVKGFQAPADGSNLGILPIALDLPTWLDVLEGIGDDDWHYDPATKTLTSGSDGIAECNLYPTRKGGAPGNRGTVDIGSSGNSTNDLKRQIEEGISAADLAHMGGSIELDANGELVLQGDTGISAGMDDSLKSRIGDTFTIPIFSKVTGPGNNADYTIVRFVGIRLLDVNFSGSASKKRVMIQPATVSMNGVIPASGTGGTASNFVFSPVFIAR